MTIKENSSAFFNLGVCHYHARDLPAAIKCWKSSLRLSPESPDAHTNLASAYVLSQPSQPDLAVKHLKTAASIAPEDPEIAYNLAAVLEACEQLDDALKQYRRAYEGGIQRADQNIRNVSDDAQSARAFPVVARGSTSKMLSRLARGWASACSAGPRSSALLEIFRCGI